MNKLLAIVGPTATGKTARALVEASRVDSIIVSADSRQVYRGMDIVTGKDHPTNATLYGIDLVSPNEPCSVAVWYEAVMPHIERAWAAGKQVIVVGGTGLYVKAVTDGIETMQVGINQSLRDNLSVLSLTELQEKLRALNTEKYLSLNHSDQSNPRRLIRAIEILSNTLVPNSPPTITADEIKIIGLTYSDAGQYRTLIEARVQQRLQVGAIQETQELLSTYSRELPSMTAIGYRSIIDYVDGNCSMNEMVVRWVQDEVRYSKRQLTWFRKVKSIEWYDISQGKI
jgi:tRNA dimethylallyltransferase